MFFSSPETIVKILVTGTLAYVGLVTMLRISGKRTLSQMNAFDFVVTVAFGSTLAAVLTNRSLTLVDGLVALGLLIALQFIVAWSSARVSFILRLVKSDPRMVFHDGIFLEKTMKAERVTRGEILQAARNQGIGSMTDIAAVVLETNGSFSIIKHSSWGDGTSTENVKES